MKDLEPLLAKLAELADRTCADREPAHDALHVRRVANAARTIAQAEGADVAVCVAAATLHEQFNLPKSHPDSSRSGEICAEHAKEELSKIGWPEERIEPVCYAIRVHGFSKGIVPTTIEAKVLQDADRLDAIGAIGIARCFATATDMKSLFYAPSDPFAKERPVDDKRFAVDHFFRKLLRIPDGLHTATARSLAEGRRAMMERFLDQLAVEIGASRSA